MIHTIYLRVESASEGRTVNGQYDTEINRSNIKGSSLGHFWVFREEKKKVYEIPKSSHGQWRNEMRKVARKEKLSVLYDKNWKLRNMKRKRNRFHQINTFTSLSHLQSLSFRSLQLTHTDKSGFSSHEFSFGGWEKGKSSKGHENTFFSSYIATRWYS